MTVLSGVVIVIFAFVGAEIVTIAAAESDEPERAVARAINSVVARVIVFYVVSVFLIVLRRAVERDAGAATRPSSPHWTGSASRARRDIMNAIIVTAVLSCLNSGIYITSRMLFALARRGDAPKSLLEINGRGVPSRRSCSRSASASCR